MTTQLDDHRASVEILRYCAARRAELKELEETARAVIEEALGEDECGTLDDRFAVTWRHHKARRLNQKALREHHPDIVEEFMETSEYRRFEVTDD